MRIAILLGAAGVLAGCASMSNADLCREAEQCPVFAFDEDRYPVIARDATIALTPFEEGAWVTVTGGPSPVLGALGTPGPYKAPPPEPAADVKPAVPKADLPLCVDLRLEEIPVEGILTGDPATATAPDGGVLAVWIEGTALYTGSRFEGQGAAMTCIRKQEPKKIAMKVARLDAETGALDVCYTLPLEDEPVYDVAVAASDSRLHFAIAGGTDRKTHVRYLSVDAADLCTP